MRKTISACLVLFLLVAPALTFAESDKPKSVPLAWVLALDPIPGDALFYSGHPYLGTACLLGGALMGGIFFSLLPEILEDDCQSSDPLCDAFSDLETAEDVGVILAGAMFVGTLVLDGVLGIQFVKEHNAKVKEKSAFIHDFRPLLGVHSDGMTAGVQFRF